MWPNFKDLNYPSLFSFAQAMTYRVLKNYVVNKDAMHIHTELQKFLTQESNF